MTYPSIPERVGVQILRKIHCYILEVCDHAEKTAKHDKQYVAFKAWSISYEHTLYKQVCVHIFGL